MRRVASSSGSSADDLDQAGTRRAYHELCHNLTPLAGRSSPTGLTSRVTMKSSPLSSARITSPLLLRSSRWVSLRVIVSNVARVRRCNFSLQEGSAQGTRQATRSRGRHRAEQRPPGGDPGERPLEDRHAKATVKQVTDREGRQSAVGVEVGAQQDAGGADAGLPQRILQACRGEVDDDHRLAYERQRRPYRVERARVVIDREMAGLPSRGGSQPRQVGGEPLLELAGPVEETSVGRGARPPTSISRPGRSGSEPAQASAAAAAFEPLAPPTALTRTTRPFISRPASRTRCCRRQGHRRSRGAATAASAAG